MTLLFLDVDGVLVNRRSFTDLKVAGQRAIADPDCIAALNHILDETGAKIVVSSVWRLAGLSSVREYLYAWGARADSVIDITPRILRPEIVSGRTVHMSAPRGDEITAWLDHFREPVESFVILDDDDDMGELSHRLVRTDFTVGLTMEHAIQATAVLNRPCSLDSTREDHSRQAKGFAEALRPFAK